jgi:hypothetical protein
VRARYFSGFNTTVIPLVERIEPFIPAIFDTTFRELAFFRADFEFMWNRPSSALAGQPILFELRINPGATANVYLNDIEIISISKNLEGKETNECETYFV